MGETNGNGRDSVDMRVEQLFTEAGIALGRVLSDRQSDAVRLSLQLFAYLIACMNVESLTHHDIIQLLKVYSRSVGHARSK